MKYFLHDSAAFQDEKVTELFMRHGYEGIGLFYTVLEKLALQEKPIKTVVLKKQLSVGKKLEKCWCFMEEIGIISSNNGETFNENLLKFSEKYKISKEKTRERVAKFRENQALEENVTRYNRVSNASKVKLSKVKPPKPPLSDLPAAASDGLAFDDFWAAYQRKEGSKSKMNRQWSALAENVRRHIMDFLPAYRAAKTVNGPQYMPMPQSFLNGRLWEAEGFVQADSGKPLPSPPEPPKPFPKNPRDLWGFNGPAPTNT